MARRVRKQCPACQQLFLGRSDAIACSERCRKRLQRARTTLVNEAKQAEHKLADAIKEVEQFITPEVASEAGFIEVAEPPSSIAQQPQPRPLPPLAGGSVLPTSADIAPAVLQSPVLAGAQNAPEFESWLDSHSVDAIEAEQQYQTPAHSSLDNLSISLPKFIRWSIALMILVPGIVLGAYGGYGLLTKHQPVSSSQSANLDNQAAGFAENNGTLHINFDTQLSGGKAFTATGPVVIQDDTNSTGAFKVQTASGNNLLVADAVNKEINIGNKPPGQVALHVNGDITTNGALVSTTKDYSLSSAGLTLGGRLVCTANGCVSSSSPPPTPASPTIDVANLAYLNVNQTFSGINTFTGNNSFKGNNSFSGHNSFNNTSTTAFQVQNASGTDKLFIADTVNNRIGIGKTPLATGPTLQVAGDLDVSSGVYRIGNTPGANLSCGANELLQQGTIQGGIITGGTCVTIAGSTIPTLQQVYDSSTPASITLSSASGLFQIQDSSSPLGTDLFEVTNNGASTKYFAVNSLGISVTGNINTTGQYSVNGSQISSANLSDGTNLAKLNGNQTFSGNNTFSSASNSFTGSFSGNGSGLTNVNAAQLNGQNSSYYTNASNISSGTLNDARLNANVTTQGNTFNGNSELVQLTAGGILPILNGSNLTALNASNIASGTLSDSRLSSNVALLNANNIFLGNDSFHLNSTALTVQDASTPLGADLFTVTNSTGATKYFEVSASGVKVNGNDVCTAAGNCTGVAGGSIGGSGTAGTIAEFTGSGFTIGNSLLSQSGSVVGVNGSINVTSGNTYQINGSQISSAALSNDSNLAKLNANQTFAGNNTFSSASNSFTGNGSGLTSVNAAELNGQAGSYYTNASNISSGTLSDNRLSSNVALLNANQTFTGNDTFSLNSAGLAVQDAASPLGTNLFEVTDNTGSTKYFTVSSTAVQVNGKDVCTTAGNCAGAGNGGGITGSGSQNYLTKFDSSGNLVDSIISDNGITATVSGTLAVNTITPTATLTIGTASQTLTLQGDASTSLSAASGGITNKLVFAVPAVSDKTITLPNASGTVAVSASGPLSLDAAGNLTCPDCLTDNGSGGGAGVSTVNSLTGDITLAGTPNQVIITPSSNTLTLSTPQDINTTSSPTFANLNLGSGGIYKINNTQISSANLSNDSNLAKLNGNQTFTGNNTFSNAVTANGGVTTTGAALGIGSSTASLALTGNYSTTLAATDGTNTTTIGFNGTATGNVTYNFNAAAPAGSYTICTTANAGACVSGGGGVTTTSNGTNGTIAMFTGSQTIANSIITQSGTTVTVGGTLNATTLTQGGTGVLLQSTSFSGDVSGAYNAISVNALAGTALSINTLADNNFLTYNSTTGKWENHSISGDLTIDHSGAATIANGVVTSAKIASGTIQASNLSSTLANSIAYLANNQTFTGNNTFGNTLTAPGLTAGGGALGIGSATDTVSLLGDNSSTLAVTDGTYTTTIGFNGTAVGNVTYNFDASAAAGSYTICTTANLTGACAGSGGVTTSSPGTNGTIAMFTGAQTIANSSITQSGTDISVGGNLSIASGKNYEINGTQISSAALSNDSNLAKLNANQTFTGNNTFQGTILAENTGTSAFQIQNAGASDNLFIADTSNNRIAIGQAAANYKLDVAGDINTTTGYRVGGTQGTGITCSGGQVVQNATVTGGIITGGSCIANGAGVTPTLQDAYNNSSSPAKIVTTSAAKNIIFEAGTSDDSTGLFQVQDSGGNSILDADSVDRFVGINNASPNATLDVLASSSSFMDGFETGALSPFSGGSGWSVGTGNAHTGSYSAGKTTGSPSDLTLTKNLNSPGNITFWAKLSVSTGCGDSFLIDGVTKQSWPSNTNIPFTQYTVSVSSGSHTFDWNYNCGGSFYVDDVTITNTGAGTTALFNGGNVGIGTSFPNETLDVSGTAHIQASSDNSSEFSVQNVAGNNYLLVDTSGANLYVGNTGIASTIQIGNTTGAVAQTINIGNNSTVSSSTTTNIGSTIGASATNITSGTGGVNLNAATTVASNISLTARGSALFKDATNSTSAFQVQDSSGNSVLDADSVDRFVGINNANPNATLDILASTSGFTDGFETGTLSPFTVTSQWIISSANPHNGSFDAYNNHGQTGALNLVKTLSSAGTISFWIAYNSGGQCSAPIFQIDGVTKLSLPQFASAPYTQYSYAVSSGTHTFTWTGNGCSNFDQEVDDVAVTNAGAGTAALFNGGNVGIGTNFPNATLDTYGTAHFEAASGGDSTTLFQIQNAAGTSLLNIDSTNSRITLGQSNVYLTDSSTPTGLSAVAGSNQGGSLSGSASNTYYYKVTAIGPNGESLPSSEVSINGASFTPISAPSSAPTVAVGSSGNPTGTFQYEYTYTTANGETTGSPLSSAVTVTSQQVNLSNVTVGATGTTSRKIYRCTSNGTSCTGSLGLVATIANNTATTVSDNTSSAGATIPASNTATTNTNNATISWTAVSGASSYRIYRGDNSGGQYAYQTSASSPFTDTGAAGTYGLTPTQSAWGSLGIGTSSPTANLQVAGTVLLKNAVNNTNALQVQNAAGSSVLNVSTNNNFFDNFESDSISPFVNGSNFSVGTGNAHSGSYSVNYSSNSGGSFSLTRTLSAAGTISFWTKAGISGAPVYTFSIDGSSNTVVNTNNTIPYTLFSYAVSAGTHTFTWQVTSGGGTSSANVDDVTVTNAAPTILVGSGSVGFGTTDPGSVYYDIVAPTSTSSAFQLQSSLGNSSVVNIDTTSNSLTVNQGNLTVTNLASPSTPTLALTTSGGSLANSTTYYYEVSATNVNGSTPAVASSPASTTTSNATSYNTLSWSSVPNAGGYNVYRSINAGSTWFVNSVSSSTTSIVDNGINYTWGASTTPPTSNTTGGNLTVNGTSTFKNATNSTSSFSVQDASGASALNVDTTDRFVGINNANPNATLDVLASSSSFYDGFETGLLTPFTENTCWGVGSGNAHLGSFSAGFTCSGPSGNLSLTKTLTTAGTISFWANIHDTCASNAAFVIDSTTKLSIGSCNNNGGYTFYSYAVSSGTHTFQWQVGGGGSGNPTYYVDDVTVTNTGAGTTALFNGGNVGIGTAFPNATLDTYGTAHFQAASGADSTLLFQIQNASGSNVVNVDSVNSRVGIDNSLTAMSSPNGLTLNNANAGANSLTATTAYYYKITAIDSMGGETTPSTFACQATTAGNKAIQMYWTAVAGASAYKIYRIASGASCGTDPGGEVYLTTVLSNYSSSSKYTDDGSITAGSATPPASTTAYVSTNNSNSEGQIIVGGNGTPTGQVYVSGTLPTDVSAGGVATGSGANSVYVVGRYAYVVDNSSNKLQVFDVSNPAAPIDVSNGGVTTASGPVRVFVQGHYAYVSDNGASKLQIFDVSNPSTPVDITGGGVSTASGTYSTYVQGRYAYVTSNAGKLQVFDVSNPASPTDVTSGGVTTGSSPQFIYVQGRYAYVTDNGSNKLQVFDVSNPASPTDVTSGGVTTGSTPFAVYVQGKYAYVVDGGGAKLQIFDVSKPSSPTDVTGGGVSTVANPHALYVQGRYAYLTGNTVNKFQVFDVSNPKAPFDISNGGFATSTGPQGIFISGRYAYSVGNSNTLQVFDLGGAYIQQLEAGGAEVGTLSVDSNAQFAGDANIQGGLSIGQSLQVAGNIGDTSGLNVQGGTILGGGKNQLGAPTGLSAGAATSGGSLSGVYKYEVTAFDPYGNETTVSNEVTTASLGSPNQTEPLTWTAVTGASGYKVYRTASGGSSGTETYLTTVTTNSYNDSGSLTLGSSPAPTTDTTGQLTVQGSALFKNTTNSTTAFQVQNSSGTTLLNVNTTNNRVSVGSIGTATGQLYVSGNIPSFVTTNSDTNLHSPQSVYIQGRYAYVVSDDTLNPYKLSIYDISNPTSPKFISSNTDSNLNQPLSVMVVGSYAYVASSGNNKLAVCNISNPANFNCSLNSDSNLNEPTYVYVQGRYAYVSSFGNGKLSIYDVSNPTSPKFTSSNTGSNVGSPEQVVVQGNYAYIADAIGKLDVCNISNPASFSCVRNSDSNLHAPYYLYVQGRYAYLTDTTGHKLSIYDVSNPTSPTFVASNPDSNLSDPASIVVQGRYAYIGDISNNKLEVYDVSNPSSPAYIGSNPDSNLNQPTSLYVQGRYAYAVSYGTNKLTVYDLGGTYSQQLEAGGTETGTLQVDNSSSFAGDVNIQGGLAVGQSLQVEGNLSDNGQALFQNSANSATAFQVQDASGDNYIQVDTSGANLYLGNTGIASTIQIGNTTGAVAQTIDIGNNSTASSTTNVVIGSTIGSSAVTIQSGSGNITLNTPSILVNGHLVTGNSSGSTTATVNGNAGTSATCSVSGNDSGGQITLVTGSAAWAAGTQCTINFANNFGSAPHPVISSANSTNDSAVQPYVGSAIGSFTINFITQDSASNTYVFNYFVAQ